MIAKMNAIRSSLVMKETHEESPPKVPLAFRVGVTGHRLNKLPQGNEELSTLRSAIQDALERLIKNPLDVISQTTDSCYAPAAPRLLMISPLAEGADRLVAE